MTSTASQSPSHSETVLSFHLNVFKSCIAIATFGASITFQVIIQQLPSEHDQGESDSPFSYNKAQAFLAQAWLLFIVALGLASFSLGLLALNRDLLKRKIENGGRHNVELMCMVASFVLQSVMLAAFFFCSLAITAYSHIPGLVAAGFVGLFWCAAAGLWAVQLR
jgi:hypothetical protein